jgi:hypothetical protein
MEHDPRKPSHIPRHLHYAALAVNFPRSVLVNRASSP